MRWTDYCRIKDELNQMEYAMKRLLVALRFGTNEEIGFEAAAVQSSLELFRHIRGHFIDSFFDIRMTSLAHEAEFLLSKAKTIIFKKTMEEDKNGKT